MRRQWPCSKCGFACSSTWRSMNPTKPVVCNSCKWRANSSKSSANSSKQGVVAETTDHHNPVSCDFKPSTTLFIRDTKVDSGLFVFGTTISDPVRVDRRGPTSKGKGKAVASGDGQTSVGIEDHFHLRLNPSTLFENHIHEEINEEAAKKLVLEELEKVSFWNVAGNVKKKKRTKLPQFKPSAMERFFNQLYHIKKEQDIVINSKSCPNAEDIKCPLHDDLFIYQKCDFIPENEIGLGAMLLPLPSKEVAEPRSSAKEVVVVVKSEPSELPPEDNIQVYCKMVGVKKSPSEEVVRGGIGGPFPVT